MTEQSTEQQLDMIGTKAEELEKTPEQAEQEQQAEEQAAAVVDESKAVAGMFTGVIETVLKLVYPMVEIDEQTREQASEVLAPVVEKYGVSMGGRWAAEINAVTFFGFAGLGVYQQIKAANEAEKEKLKNGSEREHRAA